MITMGKDYRHIMAAVAGTVWAIREEKFYAIRELLMLRAQGYAFDQDEIQARIGRPSQRESRGGGGTAVIPMLGVISQRQNLLSDTSGGISIEGFQRQFRTAMSDPQVDNIVLDIDSPGGAVPGVEEMSQEIFRARNDKRIVAVANSQASSAAFWLATSATEFVATPSADVGSVGVFAVHEDISAAEEKLGIKTSIIKAGKFKAEGHPSFPLDDDARAHIQQRVDDVYQSFTTDLARNRGVSVKTVRNDFGEGRVVSAKEALRAGMIDRIATFDEVLGRVARNQPLATQNTRAVEQAHELELRRRRLRLAMAR